MSTPTSGERLLAGQLGVEAADVAAARDVLNFIAGLSWPRPERVSLLVRLAQGVRADVGPVLGGLALDAAPLGGFDELIPINGLSTFRVRGLVRALAPFDVTKLGREAGDLHAARQTVATLRVANQTLRAELNRVLALLHRSRESVVEERPAAIRLSDVAESVTAQILSLHEVLRARRSGLRMSGVELRIRGSAAVLGEEVALDLAAPEGGSSVTLAYGPEVASTPEADVAVPDVRGYTVALARRKLRDRGLGVSLWKAGEGPEVRDQRPAPGSMVPRGAEVRLTVG